MNADKSGSGKPARATEDVLSSMIFLLVSLSIAIKIIMERKEMVETVLVRLKGRLKRRVVRRHRPPFLRCLCYSRDQNSA